MDTLHTFDATEREELNARPIGRTTGPLEGDTLRVRVSCARKVWDNVVRTGWWASRPHRVKAAFSKFPPWGFYTDKKRVGAYRVYGAREMGPDRLELFAVSAGERGREILIPPAELEWTDAWDPAQLALIGACADPWIFCDPCGWFVASARNSS